MKTIDGNSTHRHRWRRIGAHTLHAGHAPNLGTKHARPLREVRHVSVCIVAGCKEVRVHVRQEEGFAHDDVHAVAMAQQHKRIPGQTAVALVRKKNGTRKPVPTAALVERVTLACHAVEKEVMA